MKLVLDACCGSRMFWYDKENANVLFQDIRSESHVLCDGRALEIKPDVQADFTDMPHADESFYVVVFDPPHLDNLGENSWMALKYGRLQGDWRFVLKKGFNECMRVCKVNGVVIFKWNEHRIKVSELVELFGVEPLITQRTGKQNKTVWMCFMKMANAA